MIEPQPATPKYCIGQTVQYLDRAKRKQTGVVREIVARWSAWRSGNPCAFITMTVSHPSYRNGIMYLSEDSIISASTDQEDNQ